MFLSCGPFLSNGIAQDSILYGNPWVQEISLPPLYNEMANASFYTDQNGTLFIGKENGLTIIAGSEINHLPMNGPVHVTGYSTDTLYYAAENDFGYLVRDNGATFFIKSQKHLIPSSQRSFSPSDVHATKYGLFINSNNGIYLFEKNHASFLGFRRSVNRIFHLKRTILLSVTGTGILRWNGNSFQELLTEEQMGGQPALVITGQSGDLKIISATGALFSWNDSIADPRFLLQFPNWDQVTFTGMINDTQLLVNRERTGISIMNLDGKVIYHPGLMADLPDREIIQIFYSGEDKLWILATHSLHKISYPSPLQTLDMSSCGTGRILASLVNKDMMILGTDHGLFTLEQQGPGSNQWILHRLTQQHTASIHLLSASDNQVYAAGSRNLYVLADDKVTLVAEGNFSGICALSQGSVVASESKGIMHYNLDVQGWKATLIDASHPFAHAMVKHNNHLFFLCGGKVFSINENMDEPVPVPCPEEDQFFRLADLDGTLYLVGRNLVYRFEDSHEIFQPLTSSGIKKVLTRSAIIVPVSDDKFWVVQKGDFYDSGIILKTVRDGTSSTQTMIPVLQHYGNIINLDLIDNIMYITGNHQISLFNLHATDRDIRKPTIGVEAINLSGRDVTILMKGLDLQRMPVPLFRYRFAGKPRTWSEWSPQRNIKLPGLKYGVFTVEAQAMDLYGILTDPEQVSFSIKPPIYATWYAYIFYGLIFLTGLFLFQKWRLLRVQRATSGIPEPVQASSHDMVVEKGRAGQTTSEVLTEKTALMTKSKGKDRWDKYERATVLFSDIQGFTKIAEEMNPEALIDELDKFFFHFDSVVEKYNIEKIKTIGDAYMAAGGIPEKNSTNPVEVVLAALEMQSYMQHLKSAKTDIWDLRIGIHTGPVIAGVVGHKKVSYDIWGDTVNTASRMESSGMPGKVNISGITYGMVKDYFLCEYRGKLPVKYKGNIDMYFVNGLRPELSVDLKGIPNKRFFTKLQLLRLGDLEDKVMQEILSDLPERIHFHNQEHALKVYNQSFLLCRAEEIGQEDRLLVRTAALMLFTGLTQTYNNFENRSVVLCREILPAYNYSESQIDQICNLILATKQPFEPRNRLEKVLIDTRMDYLGHADYSTRIKLLYQEMKEAGIKINGQQFKKMQLEQIYQFEFYTVAAHRLREVSATDQMTILEQERWI